MKIETSLWCLVIGQRKELRCVFINRSQKISFAKISDAEEDVKTSKDFRHSKIRISILIRYIHNIHSSGNFSDQTARMLISF